MVFSIFYSYNWSFLGKQYKSVWAWVISFVTSLVFFPLSSFRLLDEKKDVLILVFLEEIPTSLLSPYYRMRKLVKKTTYLSWPRAGKRTEVFWEKLRQALRTGEDAGGDRLRLTVVDRQHQVNSQPRILVRPSLDCVFLSFCSDNTNKTQRDNLC